MKGTLPLQAAEALRAGGPGALVFNLFEGEIENPVRDNEPVGSLKITGEDFDTGVISPGDKLDCEFEVSDSGRVSLSVSVSKVGAMKSGEFYSRTVPPNYDDPDTRQLVLDESRAMICVWSTGERMAGCARIVYDLIREAQGTAGARSA